MPKRGRPTKYTARHRFLIEVLNLRGLPASKIVHLMNIYGVPMTVRSVQSIIHRLPYRRAEMPPAVRQRFLDRLKANRLDRNYGLPGLPDEFFIIGDDDG